MKKGFNSSRRFPIDGFSSIDTIAHKAGVTAKKLIEYHNANSSYEEYIHDNDLSNIKHMYVNHYFHYLYSGLSMNGGMNMFLYNKPATIAKQYNIQYTHTQGDEQTTIFFEIALQFIKTIEQEYHVYELTKISPTILNNEIQETDIQEINQKINTLIYPLQIITHPDGSYKEVIYNTQLPIQWKSLKKELLEEYQGNSFQKIIQHNENIINNEQQFIEQFHNFWLFNILFPPLYTIYDSNELMHQHIQFPLIEGTPPLQFKVYRDFNNIDTTGNLFKFSFEGHLDDSRDKTSLEYATNNPNFAEITNTPLQSSYQQKIMWNKKQQTLQEASINITLDLETPIKCEIAVNEIENNN